MASGSQAPEQFSVITGRQIINLPSNVVVGDPVCEVVDCGCVPADPTYVTTIETRRLHFPSGWTPDKWQGPTWCEVDEQCCPGGSVSGSGPTLVNPCCSDGSTINTVIQAVFSNCGFGVPNGSKINLAWNAVTSQFVGTGVLGGIIVTVFYKCVGGVPSLSVTCAGVVNNHWVKASDNCGTGSPYKAIWNWDNAFAFNCFCKTVTIQDVGGGGGAEASDIIVYVRKQRVYLPPHWMLGEKSCVVNDCTEICQETTIPCEGQTLTLPNTLYGIILAINNPSACKICPTLIPGAAIPINWGNWPVGFPADNECDLLIQNLTPNAFYWRGRTVETFPNFLPTPPANIPCLCLGLICGQCNNPTPPPQFSLTATLGTSSVACATPQVTSTVDGVLRCRKDTPFSLHPLYLEFDLSFTFIGQPPITMTIAVVE